MQLNYKIFSCIFVFMSQAGETFFTSIGCMDGRVHAPIAKYGQDKFGAQYPDTITEAGKVGILAHNPSPEFLAGLKAKLDISLNMHHSKGILVHGHQECAGNPVDDETHTDDVKESVRIIKEIVGDRAPVLGVFVKRSEIEPTNWEVEEL